MTSADAQSQKIAPPWLRIAIAAAAVVSGLAWTILRPPSAVSPYEELAVLAILIAIAVGGFALYNWFERRAAIAPMQPATPAAPAPRVDEESWLLPVGLAIAILLVSIGFVHDDPTTNAIQFLLASGAAAVLGWGYVLTRRLRS